MVRVPLAINNEHTYVEKKEIHESNSNNVNLLYYYWIMGMVPV